MGGLRSKWSDLGWDDAGLAEALRKKVQAAMAAIDPTEGFEFYKTFIKTFSGLADLSKQLDPVAMRKTS